MERVIPVNQLGLKKVGTCGVCGKNGKLTDSHVPPRCAGNSYIASPTVFRVGSDSSVSLGAGRPRNGGSRAFLLCGRCNSRIGTWDDYFGDFWNALDKQIDKNRVYNNVVVVGVLEQGYPGAIIRSILGGMFAINPNLRSRWPDVSEAILTGVAVEPPSDMALLIELYLGDRGWVTGGGAKMSAEIGLLSYVDGEWVWPPVHVVLTRPIYNSQWPRAMNIASWLKDPGTLVRRIDFMLPIVDDQSLWGHF